MLLQNYIIKTLNITHAPPFYYLSQVTTISFQYFYIYTFLFTMVIFTQLPSGLCYFHYHNRILFFFIKGTIKELSNPLSKYLKIYIHKQSGI